MYFFYYYDILGCFTWFFSFVETRRRPFTTNTNDGLKKKRVADAGTADVPCTNETNEQIKYVTKRHTSYVPRVSSAVAGAVRRERRLSETRSRSSP